MTLVAALRSGTRVVMMSDTSIVNRDAAHPNVFPGRLKAVVLSDKLTISYAGLSSQALDVIRVVHREPKPTDAVVGLLANASRRFEDELDFLLCSHDEPSSPRLLKITNGSVAEGADFYWIGHRESANVFEKYEVPALDATHGPDFQSEAERHFAFKFHRYVQEGRDPNVGGATVNCLCSPFGHCYQDHAGTQSWKTISIPDLTPSYIQAAEYKSGAYSYSYHVYSAAERGVPVVGVYLEQAGVGYLHVPLDQDDPVKVRCQDQGEFAQLVRTMGTSSSTFGRLAGCFPV